MFSRPYSYLIKTAAAATVMVAVGTAPCLSSSAVRSETLSDRVAASRMKIRGVVLYRAAWMMLPEDKRAYGVYEFPVTADASSVAYDAVKTGRRFGVKECFSMGDKYWTAYAIEENYQILSMDFYTYDADTWEESSALEGNPDLSLSAVAWSDKDNTAYACTHGAVDGYSAYLFGWFDHMAGSFHTIGRAQSRLQSIAVHSDGTIYGIEENGYLVAIDPASGSYSKVIGQTGLKSHFRTDCAIDSEENVMYFVAAMQDNTSVYAVDLETGSSVRLYDLPDFEQVRGLYMWPDPAAGKVPAIPAELKLDFPGRSLAGTVSFRTPTRQYDGTEGSGKLNYTVIAGGQVYEGETGWGTMVSVPVEFGQAAERRFAVRLSNIHGAGPALRARAWIGEDKPLPVTDAKARWTDGHVQISWEPSEGSLHGGHFSPEEVSYTVIRREDGILIGEGIKSSEAVDPVDEPCNRIRTFTYSVIPYSGDCCGESLLTAPVAVGYIRPFYRNAFKDASSLDGFVAVDANGDGKTWKYYEEEKCVRIAYNTKKEMDDWLFTPEIELAAGRECTFGFRCKAHDKETVERLAVAVATDTTSSSVVKTIMEPTEIKGTGWVDLKASFTAAVSGRYRLAFHGVSDREQFYLYLDDLVVDDGSPDGIEEMVRGVDDTAPEYYTLTGLRVARPKKGIYMEVRGTTRRKVIF